MSDSVSKDELLSLTTKIVSSHVSNNSISANELSSLIKDVYNTMLNLGKKETVTQGLTPAVPVKKSVTPDYIICLEDGKRLKMLKRHLKTAYNMTPDDYRERWNLPADYPMVAPNYAAKRSYLAKEIGLGTVANRIED